MKGFTKTVNGRGVKTTAKSSGESGGASKLEDVMERCRAIEEKSLNPFLLDVDSILEIIQKYFPSWEQPEELSLDAAALNSLANVIRLQSEWVQRRSTSLYMDPAIIEQRLKEMSRDEIAVALTSAWCPILELETMTVDSLREAIEYWHALPLLSERWPQLLGGSSATPTLDRREFLGLGLVDGETFEARLEALYRELRRRAGAGRLSYWDFIMVEDFEESVERSYLTSFLVSFGWATLQIHPIEGDIFILPSAKIPEGEQGETQSSVVLSISREEWERRRARR